MSAVDVVGTIGDLLSWIGVLAGIPLLAIGLMIRLAEGAYAPASVTILDDIDDRSFALWSVQGRTCTRPLSVREHATYADRTTVPGFVSTRDPERMRFEKRSPPVRVCLVLAAVMLGAAILGFLASLLPLVA
ncbi:hypothetical protein [Microbacterium sp. CIAB417]|uniref:hypothetical protein n=1 Tax=Microbacterium sp. CIAB417 TaxID=2860287 RepID=UPI001FAD6E6A|nr:hypothetical protein [Microbacterium sp. CIAB417]